MTPLHRDEPRILGPLPGPRSTAWLERDHRVMSPSYTRVYPLVVRARGGRWSRTWTATASSTSPRGSPSPTSGTPTREVVRAIERQSRRLIHMSGTDFYYAPQVRLAERLAALAPGPDPSASSSPTAGPRRSRPRSSWRGGTPGETGPWRSWAPSTGEPTGRCRCPARSRCSGGASRRWCRRSTTPATAISRACTRCCGRSVPPRSWRRSSSSRSRAKGGTSCLRPDFLPGLRKLCDEHKVLLVLDEVQSGFGRTGKLFACEHWGVEGDILCLAKGIANGLPLGAIVARASVMDWPSGSHASTFGGNPVACAASLAALRLIEAKYRAKAEVRGAQLRAGLELLAERHPMIREVRGLGLMIGAEVQDPAGHPAPLLRDRIIELAFHRGLLLLPCGASTIRFCPPLCLTRSPGRDRAGAPGVGHGRGRCRDRGSVRPSPADGIARATA